MGSEQGISKENLTMKTSSTMNNLITIIKVLADQPKFTAIAQVVIGIIGISGSLCLIITFFHK